MITTDGHTRAAVLIIVISPIRIFSFARRLEAPDLSAVTTYTSLCLVCSVDIKESQGILGLILPANTKT